MYPPKKKCRKVLIWLSFAVAAQVMFSLLLRGEFNLTPIRRSRTTEITQRTKAQLKLQSRDFDQTKVNYDLIPRSKQESLNFMKSGEIKENQRNTVDSPPSGTDIQNPLRGLRRNGFSNMSTSLARRGDAKLKEAVLSDLSARKNTTATFEVSIGVQKGASTKELREVFISVKTTGAFHESRVTILLHTWFQGAKDQAYFFTDTDDGKMNESLGGHLIKTPCEIGHQRQRLCCKMQAELDFFVHNVGAKWFCHFDDDNYVNVPTLVTTLQTFDPSRNLYLGKPSLARKMEAWDSFDGNKKKMFWFATGGAGFCLSRTLVNKMSPYISDGKFVQTCDRIKLPDDCTIGFISEVLLLVNLTRSDLFHSHLENLLAVKQQAFNKQISISHGYMGRMYNRVTIDGPFDLLEDPSRFKSVHCLLHPETSWCPKSEKAPTDTLHR